MKNKGNDKIIGCINNRVIACVVLMASSCLGFINQVSANDANAAQTKAADEWLLSSPVSGYTVQVATVFGLQNCLDVQQQFSTPIHCFESSTVSNRWFAVTGAYEKWADATQAMQALDSNQPWVNSLERIRRTRCEMPDVNLPALCGGNSVASAESAPVTEALPNVTVDSVTTEGQVVAEEPSASSPAPITPKQVAAASTPTHDGHDGNEDSHASAKGKKKGGKGKKGHHEPRLSTEPKPYLTEKELGNRTPPLIEWGGDFLGTGNIRRGFILPTGAVWTPQFWVYGTGRSAFQTYERATDQESSSEWVNRLDLFGNLQLSGTERVVLGISPLHREDVAGDRFTGQIFSPDEREGSINRFNSRVRTLFFEGDLAELFPLWDARDGKKNDIGFTVGRQGVLFQDGMTINDTLDSIGLSKNNIRFEGVPWLVNWRSSVLYAWDEVNRGNNQPDEEAELYAWFNQWDTLKSTIDLDLIYVDSDNDSDQFVASLDFIQRLGKIGSTFRIAHSAALDEESAVVGDGTLLFSEFNYVPAYTKDNMYLNVFASFDNYTSAARDPLGGGPLGRVGLLYAASGLGSYPAPLSNNTNDAYGFSAGYQKIDNKKRRQLTIELGARDSDDGNAQYGLAARFQQALGKRFVFQVDGFVADQEDLDTSYGARLELLLKL